MILSYLFNPAVQGIFDMHPVVLCYIPDFIERRSMNTSDVGVFRYNIDYYRMLYDNMITKISAGTFSGLTSLTSM